MARIDFTVTTAADGGAGSLRQVLAEAQLLFAPGAGGEDDYAAIGFADNLDGQTIRLASRLEITQGNIRIDGDIDGDGDADITVSGDTNGNGTSEAGDSALLRVGAGASATLESLTLSKGFASEGDSDLRTFAIGNYGALTIRNSTIDETYVVAERTPGTLFSTADAAAIFNGGFLRIADTLISRSFILGGDGRNAVGGSTANSGTDAAAGILNEAGAQLAITRSGFTGSAFGGDGGDGDGNYISAGSGGDAALVAINRGAVVAYGAGAQILGIDPSNTVQGGFNGGGGGGSNGVGADGIRTQPGGTVSPAFAYVSGPGGGLGTAAAELIDRSGQGAAQIVLGFGGADTILGGTGNDTLYGGAGNDEIRIGSGAQVFADGGAGSDRIVLTGLTGAHVLRGGAESFDALDVSALAVAEGQTGVDVDLGSAAAQTVRAGLTLTLSGFNGFIGTRGADRAFGTAQTDFLIGFSDVASSGRLFDETIATGADSLYGGGARDYIVAGGAIRVSGGAEGDFLFVSGAGMYVTGDGGDDLIFVSGGSGVIAGGGGEGTADDGADAVAFRTDFGVFVSLLAGVATDLPNFGALNLSIAQIESVVGTEFADQLTGDDEANRFDGGRGADELFGGGGGDELSGGAGNDTLVGGLGADRLDGGSESDSLFGEGGDDTLNGETGNDTLEGGGGLDVIDGGAGADTAVFRSALSDFTLSRSGAALVLRNGADRATVTNVESFFFEGTGTRTLAQLLALVDPSTPPAGPTQGDDDLTGTGGPDRIAALAGDDTVRGLGGADTLLGQGGLDALRGGGGDDSLVGGGGADSLLGQGANDTLKGGGAGDVLKGGGGADRLIGGGGADTIEGNKGADTMIGGGGADLFRFAPGDGADVIQRFQQGVDRVEFKRGVADFGDLRIEQRGEDVLVSHERGSILFENQSAGAFGEEDFLF